MPDALSADFFARSVHEVAPDLIGVTLLVDGVGGPIVEVEAYDPTDPASHAFRGRDTAERRRCSARRATRTSTAPTGSTGASTSSARRRARRRRSCCARWSRPRVSSGCATGDARRRPTARRRPGPPLRGAAASRASTTACRSTVRRSSSFHARPSPRSSQRRESASPAPPTTPGATCLKGSRYLSRSCTQSVTGSPAPAASPALRPLADDTPGETAHHGPELQPLEPGRRLADRQPDHARGSRRGCGFANTIVTLSNDDSRPFGRELLDDDVELPGRPPPACRRRPASAAAPPTGPGPRRRSRRRRSAPRPRSACSSRLLGRQRDRRSTRPGSCSGRGRCRAGRCRRAGRAGGRPRRGRSATGSSAESSFR